MERFLTNDSFISFHRNRLDLEEFPEDKLSIAYLDNKFNMFYKHLTTGEDFMIKKVLKEIFNQQQDATEIYKYAIERPEIFSLIYSFLLTNKDVEIRILSSLCFKQFCIVLTVKEQLEAFGFIKTIGETFKDESSEVKLNVYQGLIYYSQSRFGTDTLLKNEIIEQLITRMTFEKDIEVLKLILILHNRILESDNGPHIALKKRIIAVLKNYIESSDEELREYVIMNYGSLAICEEGKWDTVEEGKKIYC
jgi:septum formation topological specificity factor MinE